MLGWSSRAEKQAMAIVADGDLCPSMSIDAIGSILKRPAGEESESPSHDARRKK